MAYSESLKETNLKYFKNNQKRIALNWLKDDYENRIAPAIKRSGMPTSTFVKEAIEEKLVRDALLEENSKFSLEYTLDRIKKIIIRDIPKVLKDDCREIIMYGSCARGDNTKDSDIDIALLTKSSEETNERFGHDLASISAEIMNRYQELVSFICVPYVRFEKEKSWYLFYKNIDKEGIVIYG